MGGHEVHHGGRKWLPLLVALLLGLIGFDRIAQLAKPFDPDSAAVATEVRRNSFDGATQIGFMVPNQRAFTSFRAIRNAGHDVVLWLAASQSYTIVDFRQGDRPAVEIATQAAIRRGAPERYVQTAVGLMNLNEMFHMLAGFIQHGMVPKAVVLGLVYNDFDSSRGIRPALLREIPVTVDDELRRRGIALPICGTWCRGPNGSPA